jgi:predicted amidohydrolase YtcJ
MIQVLTPSSTVNQEYFIDRAQELATRFGYTTAQEGRAFTSTHQALKDYSSQGRLLIDVVSYIDYANKEIIGPEISREYLNRYRIGGMKITLDGSPQGRTAWAKLPYLIPPDGQEEGYRGYPAIPNDSTVAALYDEAMENNWQVLTHTNGDAAIDQMIRAMAPAIRRYPERDHRNVMIHGQFARQDQLDSLAKLNIIPSFFAMHAYYWGDWYDQIIGEERAQQISPTRSALDRGMILTSHTDAPVALPDPINAMHITVNRKSRSGKIMGPDERLTPYEALKAITIWGAYQHLEEENKGSITDGKLADFVILDANPLKIDPEGIRDITVLETIKEGQTVYRKE